MTPFGMVQSWPAAHALGAKAMTAPRTAALTRSMRNRLLRIMSCKAGSGLVAVECAIFAVVVAAVFVCAA